MSEAGHVNELFARFARVEARSHPITLLEEDGSLPAFIVHTKMLTDTQERTLRERHTNYPKKFRAGQPREKELNAPKYWPAWLRQAVTGWEGLTKGNMERLIVGFVWEDESEFDRAFPDGNVPFSMDWALQLHEVAESTFTLALFLEMNRLRQAQTEQDEGEEEEAVANLNNGSGSSTPSASTAMSPHGAPASTVAPLKSVPAAPSDATG